jgi:hypothetical protein
MIVDKSGKMWVIEAAGGASSIGNRVRVLVDMNTPTSVYHRAGSASGSGGYNNGTGIGLSLFNNPTGIVTDTLGNIYIADAGNNAIRKVSAYINVSTPQTTSTFAGSATGASGNVDDLGTAASFNTPTDLAIDSLGNIYVADALNNTIRKITPSGAVSTWAGSGSFGSADGTGILASFTFPTGLAWFDNRTLLIADQGNKLIRKMDIITRVVTTIAGNKNATGIADGDAMTQAGFLAPTDIAVDGNKNIYVTEGSPNGQPVNIIRKISGTCVSTFAGTNGVTGTTNGDGAAAKFNNPSGIIFYNGFLYVADQGNQTIRKITPSTTVPQPAPVAGFASPVTSGVTNTTYTFHDSTSIVPNSRIWRFTPSTVTYMGGTDSSSKDVQIQFTAKGTYNVTLKLANCWGVSTTPAHTIGVNNVGVNEVNANQNLSVYPNPTKGLFEISLTGNTDANLHLSVMDIQGKIVYERSSISNKEVIDLGNVSKGIYLLKISGKETSINKKIIVE